MGMFDSVIGKCPHCKKEVELQSKAGPCLLGVYDPKKVPVSIAQDLNKNLKDYNSTCHHCKEKFVLLAPLKATVECKLVPLTPELEKEINEEKEDEGASYEHLD